MEHEWDLWRNSFLLFAKQKNMWEKKKSLKLEMTEL